MIVDISLTDMTNDNNKYRFTGALAVCSSSPWQVTTNDSNHQVQEWSSMVHDLFALTDKNLKECMYRYTVDELPPLLSPLMIIGPQEPRRGKEVVLNPQRGG